MKLFANKNALITGASSGIGKAVAERLARNGCNLILLARRLELLESLAEELRSSDIDILTMRADITDESQVKECFNTITQRFKSLEFLVNAAGQILLRPFASTPAKLRENLIRVNLEGTFNVTAGAIKLMHRGSAIVNFSSVTGLLGAPMMGVYSATKAAIIGWSRSLAKELAYKHIRVNVVAPGIVRTNMTEELFRFYTKQQIADLESRHLLGFGTAEQIAATVAFLLSEDAGWITGAVINVDGGLSINVD